MITIIKIAPDEYGYHDDQTIYTDLPESFVIPEGYAILPKEIGTPDILENYPYADISVDVQNGLPTITKWLPLPVPNISESKIESISIENRLSALEQAMITLMKEG